MFQLNATNWDLFCDITIKTLEVMEEIEAIE